MLKFGKIFIYMYVYVYIYKPFDGWIIHPRVVYIFIFLCTEMYIDGWIIHPYTNIYKFQIFLFNFYIIIL